jgi:hypothetical protein
LPAVVLVALLALHHQPEAALPVVVLAVTELPQELLVVVQALNLL